MAVDMAWGLAEEVILVLPHGRPWDGRPVTGAVSGGSTRLASAVAGVAALSATIRIVLIHDAAHPLATEREFREVIEAVRAGADAAVPFVPTPDVIKRRASDSRLTTVGRDGLGLALVPMGFSRSALESAYDDVAGSPTSAWEDSMLIENLGGRVVAVAGSRQNFHVVTDEDLRIARALAKLD